MKKNQIKYNELWNHLNANMTLSPDSIHGSNHWKAVEKNGLYLSKSTGANVLVVILFALFHDCRRLNDGTR